MSKNAYTYFICMVGAFGGLLFGYDWVVIGGAKPFYEAYFGIGSSPGHQGLAMTVALIGCMFGALTVGWLADRMGRKKLLTLSSIVFLLSALATGAVVSFNTFLIARFFGGVGIGLASGLSPMYIAEVAPASIRGRMVSLNQMMIVIGILAAQIVNWLIAQPMPAGMTEAAIAQSWNGQMAWRWMFWVPMLPSAIFFVLSLFIPESPRWLQMRGHKGDATATQDRGSLSALFSRRYAAVLLLGIFIAVFQQWCGTNVIFNYAQEIFQQAGYEIGDVLFNIVVTGIANLVFTIVALHTVDRLGRHRRGHDRAGGAGHWLLCHDPWPLHLGADLRDLPRQGSVSGRVDVYLCFVDRLLHAHLHLPLPQPLVGQLRYVLDLCRCLCRWLHRLRHQAEGDKRHLTEVIFIIYNLSIIHYTLSW